MTAVEWVLQYLNNVKPNEFCSIEKIKGLCEQAKEMEKEKIMDAFQAGKWDWAEHSNNNKHSKDPAEYYNETFKKD
jgi:hypothetical protein